MQNDFCRRVLDKLHEDFTLKELHAVLSHSVGAMRKYCLRVFLLDLHDPTRVIGRLREPLLSPNETEREGYVPNVVYSCDSQLYGREIIIPYAMNDSASSRATVSLDELLSAME